MTKPQIPIKSQGPNPKGQEDPSTVAEGGVTEGNGR
jgi:hypothetical protein